MASSFSISRASSVMGSILDYRSIDIPLLYFFRGDFTLVDRSGGSSITLEHTNDLTKLTDASDSVKSHQIKHSLSILTKILMVLT